MDAEVVTGFEAQQGSEQQGSEPINAQSERVKNYVCRIHFVG
jgi:hypothetical protein